MSFDFGIPFRFSSSSRACSHKPNLDLIIHCLLMCSLSLSCQLGICYGMQEIAQHFGGKVEAAEKREYGFAKVTHGAGDEGLVCPLVLACPL